MKPTIEQMKEYNRLIARFNKAEVYFNDEKIPLEDKWKQENNVVALINNISLILIEIKATGYKISDDEILNGFKIQE